jgi:Tol biopolymer transport system component
VWRWALLPILVCGLCVMPAAAAAAPKTERVSVSSAGREGKKDSLDASISANGRFVAFESAAPNLVKGDTNDAYDVFVRDRATGTTTRVSVSSAGRQGRADSYEPSISANGRFVAFESTARNLVKGDGNGYADVFVHDRATGTTTRVSVHSRGREAEGMSSKPAISDDGRIVAFESTAPDLVRGDENGFKDVFVHDRVTSRTSRVSVGSAGVEGDADSHRPAVSADGRFVAFVSDASNLVGGDGDDFEDVFVHDRATGRTRIVSISSAGVKSDNGAFDPSISDDGRFVAFSSSSSNLVKGDEKGYSDVFVHDRQRAKTTRVSVSSAGREAKGASSSPSISGNGRFVAFHSAAPNLVKGDTNDERDVFVHDRATGRIIRASVSTAGREGKRFSDNPSISNDGRFVAFQTRAWNLVRGDENDATDVLVRGPLT